MENTTVQEVKMPITYDDLKASMIDSGRPYDFEMIDRAYELAAKAHGEQRRRSGEPYICHPLSVAQILVELGMDSESIAAALMHDVAEDTPVSVTEIRQILSGGCKGREVRVNGAVHTIRSMGEVAFVVLRKAGGPGAVRVRGGAYQF